MFPLSGCVKHPSRFAVISLLLGRCASASRDSGATPTAKADSGGSNIAGRQPRDWTRKKKMGIRKIISQKKEIAKRNGEEKGRWGGFDCAEREPCVRRTGGRASPATAPHLSLSPFDMPPLYPDPKVASHIHGGDTRHLISVSRSHFRNRAPQFKARVLVF
ncbi:hypothetical protein SKAU_G00124110 [Synaphobranchus kaupii]|uniref:Secreted protein n=1 Tax=Synaphobranchus kaupii TaxID=118154 RepID=A0A9Q1FP44_SYNKA|nr:hypothetical protein SKAU_G00124110 [Synaphobranchus kaupii]